MRALNLIWVSLLAIAWVLVLVALIVLWVKLPRGANTGGVWLSPPYPISVDENGALTLDGTIGTRGERYTMVIQQEIWGQTLSPEYGSLLSELRAPFQIVQAQVKLYDEVEIRGLTAAERRERWRERVRSYGVRLHGEIGDHLRDADLPVPRPDMQFFAANIDDNFARYWRLARWATNDTVVIIRWRAVAMYLLFLMLGAVEVVLTPVLLWSLAVMVHERQLRSRA